MSASTESFDKKSKRPFWKWRSVRIITVLVVAYCLIFYIAIPLVSKTYLQRWLVENGAENAVIGKVVLRPFLGVIALEGVHVEREGKTVFSNATIYFDLGLKNLLGKEAHIQKATLADIVIDLEKYADGSFRVGSYKIDPAAPSSPETPSEVAEQVEKDVPWVFFARQVSLSNVTLRYRQPEMQVEVVIEEALLEKFNTDPDNKQGALFLKAMVNGSPVELELSTLNVSPTVEVNGTIAISNFLLDELEGGLSPYLNPFKGTAGLQGDIDFAMTYDLSNLNVHYNGLIDLENGDIAGAGWATRSGVRWDGALTFSILNKDMEIEVDGDLRTTDSSFDLASPVIDVDNRDIRVSGPTRVSIGEEVVIDTGASLHLAPTHFAMDYLGADTGELKWDGSVKVATGTKTTPLTVDVNGDLRVADPAYNMDMGDGKLETGTSSLDWDGKVLISVGSGDDPIVVEVDGALGSADTRFQFPAPSIEVDNEDLKITGKTTISIDEEVGITTDAILALASTKFGMQELDTSLERFDWKGDVDIGTGSATAPFKVSAEGNLRALAAAYGMTLGETDMAAGGEQIGWDGLVEFVMEPGSGGSSTIQTDGKLALEAAKFSLPGTVELTQGSLEAEGESRTRISGGLGVSYDGDLQLEQTRLELPELAVGEERLAWTGTAGYEQQDERQDLALDGTLRIDQIFADVAGADLYVSQELLEITPSFTLVLEEAAALSGELALDGEGLAIQQKGSPLLNLQDIAMSNATGNETGGLSIESLAFNALEMPSSDSVPVNLVIPAISLLGIESPDLASLSIRRLAVEKPLVIDADGSTDLARLDTFAAENIRTDQDLTVSIDRIGSGPSEFLVSEGKDPVARLEGVSISDISYSRENGLVTDTIAFDSLQGRFSRKKAEDTGDQPPQEEAPESGKEERTAGLPVKINQIDLTGSSGLKFTDTSMARTFITLFSIESLQVKDIDLNQIDQPFSYTLEGAIDKYSPVSMEGSVAPLADNLALSHTTTVRNLSMPHLSPYAIEAIGTWFPEGRLDIDSTLEIGSGNIDMDNGLLFKDLVTETLDGKLADELNNQLPIPLDMALSLLRDKDGVIAFDVPVHGPLSSFSIGIADILITALSQSITTAVAPYLAYTALGPTGALAYVGVKLGQSLLETKLPILEFEPGEAALNETHTAQLDEAGPILEGEEEQTHNICAKVSVGELTEAKGGVGTPENQGVAVNEAIRRELFQLGEARSLAVQGYLVEKFNIAEDRLLICNPGLLFQKDEKPRVEFRK